MPKLKDINKIAHPREKLAKYGPGKLSNTELLAILLRTGGKNCNVLQLAKKIFKQYPKQSLIATNVAQLRNIKDLGLAKACEIVACIELGKRLLKDKPAQLILSAQDVWDRCGDIRPHKKEHFVVFYLDNRHQEIKRDTVSIGTLTASLVHPREVFEPAISHSAAHILVAHNHPSGELQPSTDDIEITRRLIEAGKILGIELLDHVIVTRHKWLSMKKEGLAFGKM
ncbi:MAG: DNA repair protein RadC [Patescibacteria group bacterium]